jgi:hypothetical protein
MLHQSNEMALGQTGIPAELLEKRREGGFIRYTKTSTGEFASYYGKCTIVEGKPFRTQEYLV